MASMYRQFIRVIGHGSISVVQINGTVPKFFNILLLNINDTIISFIPL